MQSSILPGLNPSLSLKKNPFITTTIVGSAQHPHQSTNYKDSNYKNSEITPPQNIRELLGFNKSKEAFFEHSVQNKRQKNAIIFILVLLACAAGATTIVLRHKERNNRNN